MRILSLRRFRVSSIRSLFLINRLRPAVRVHCGISTVRIAGNVALMARIIAVVPFVASASG